MNKDATFLSMTIQNIVNGGDVVPPSLSRARVRFGHKAAT